MLTDYPWCYLVTTGEERPQHAGGQAVARLGGLRCETGRSSRVNVVRNALVGDVSAVEDGRHVVDLDGEAEVDGDRDRVKPTWAVLLVPR